MYSSMVCTFFICIYIYIYIHSPMNGEGRRFESCRGYFFAVFINLSLIHRKKFIDSVRSRILHLQKIYCIIPATLHTLSLSPFLSYFSSSSSRIALKVNLLKMSNPCVMFNFQSTR